MQEILRPGWLGMWVAEILFHVLHITVNKQSRNGHCSYIFLISEQQNFQNARNNPSSQPFLVSENLRLTLFVRIKVSQVPNKLGPHSQSSRIFLHTSG